MAKKKRTPKAAARTPRKGVGRPGPGNRKIVPNDYDRMSSLYGTGCTFAQIAREYGVHPNTIAHHFTTHIFPIIQASSSRSLASQLVKIEAIYRYAWKGFFSESPSEKRRMLKHEIAKLSSGEQSGELKKLLEETLTTVHRIRDKTWINIAQWCVDMCCRLDGHYAAVKVSVELDEYRVAGLTPGERMRHEMAYLQQQVVQQREYEKKLEASGIEFGRMTAPSEN